MRLAISFMGLMLALATGPHSWLNATAAREKDGPRAGENGLAVVTSDFLTGNWPGWRGGDGSGVSGERDLPTRWSTDEGVAWKTPVPGAGNSSPVVWGERVFLTTAEERGRRRAIVCFDRMTGKQLWKTDAPSDATERTHKKNGFASATPATDGSRVYAFFGSAGAMAVDFEGKRLWHRGLGEFTTTWGTASSPVLFKNLLFLNCDQDGGSEDGGTRSFLVALNKETGETVWHADRPHQPRSWSTPVLVPAKGSDEVELVLNGGHKVWAYDVRTGQSLWSCEGTTQWVTPTVVASDGLLFAVSGRNGPTLAIRPGGRGDVTASHLAWQAKRGGPYIPSPVVYGARLYMVNDGGIMTCYEAATGRMVYQERLAASNFSASLLAADDKMYISNEDGDTFVLAAGDEFKILHKNSLGERCLASPAVSRGQMFLRTERHLWCIGKK